MTAERELERSIAGDGLMGKVALVTGASRGIGKAIASALGKAGAIVIGTATSESGAAAITDALQAEGIQGQGMALNVTSADECQAVLKVICAEYGAPLILINNAGITRDNILMRMKEEEWDDVIDTNLSSIFRMSKAVLRGMTKARWGRIVNISSVVGSMGNQGQANYAAAKAGIEGFTRAMAREVGSRSITVNTVAPGFIETDMTRALPEEQQSFLLGQIPLARLGQPEEIAAAVAFLVSEPAGYITGETLHVNGGMYMN
ncbi:3-oxoacyl-ACP reductase FabG [Endozoicomonas acroporae]|uniref:3-oxoacyl-ACP reductase FabG n=1 Tax=Endozoicomonas acroporae TaxID=1701104 RepID=UPI000C76CF66|nr:3-oxoacyl-ACP reductase FabG [Endozoicomonas acroporae]